MPILNSGMGKEAAEPFSGETVVETASRASSLWCEGTMEVGRERRRYLPGFDILAGTREECQGVEGVALIAGLDEGTGEVAEL